MTDCGHEGCVFDQSICREELQLFQELVSFVVLNVDFLVDVDTGSGVADCGECCIGERSQCYAPEWRRTIDLGLLRRDITVAVTLIGRSDWT